jgi:2-keto-4-pentenoate hydratase
MMTEPAVQAAADLLWDTWQAGARLDSFPPTLCPTSRAEAYVVQACLETRSPQPLFGWKIAATSPAGQAHIGVDGPMAGRILAETVVPDGGTVALAGNVLRVAEPEFVFRLARDLVPRSDPYEVEEAMSAVAALHLGIEVPGSRFADFATAGEMQLIADDACAHRWALGPEAPALWRGLDLSTHSVQCSVAPRYERGGVGGNVLGDPRLALTWLANELSAHGVTLRAGQYVTTGTCMAPLEVEPGDRVTADFGSLGSMSLRFTA